MVYVIVIVLVWLTFKSKYSIVNYRVKWCKSQTDQHYDYNFKNLTRPPLSWSSKLKEGFCIYFFCPRMRPKTFLQCFAIDSHCSKVKHCRNVLGRVLGRKNKVQCPSLNKDTLALTSEIGVLPEMSVLEHSILYFLK